MNIIELQQAIIAGIDAVAGAERITKKALSELSRQLLDYIVMHGSSDVAAINRLLAVLTPMNKRVAVAYFQEFIPHSFDEKKCEFGGKFKSDKKYQKIVDKATEWLSDPSNDIWVFSEGLEVTKAKKLDFDALLKQAIQRGAKALDEPEEYAELSLDVSQDTLDSLMAIIAAGAELQADMQDAA